MRTTILAALTLSLIAATSFADKLLLETEQSSLECTLYTKPYTATEHGAFALPDGLEWTVMPRYVGRTETGETIIDDRLTLVLKDKENSFWPVIAKMSLGEAESLQEQLSTVIAQKRKALPTP